MQFNDKQIQRYSRHLILPEIGLEGQKKISSASVLCIGAGGLGSPAVIYLSAAGIGKIGIVDFDIVDISNLQRQVIHTTNNIGIPKTDSASQAIKAINPDVKVDLYKTKLSPSNAYAIFKNYDVILDCSDNFPTRYLINDVSVNLRKPVVYGSVFQFGGQATVFAPHMDSPCYRCLYPEPPPPNAVPSCAEAGVFCIVPGIIGLIQANETLKLILGIGSLLTGRLLVFDALEVKFREIRLKRDPACPVCGKNPSGVKPMDYEELCTPDSDAQSIDAHNQIKTVHQSSAQRENSLPNEITPDELKNIIESGNSDIRILDVREKGEMTSNMLAGSIHIPLSLLEKRLSELNPDVAYCVVCQFGIRSKAAAEILKARGFKNVRHLKGGLISYFWTH
jgi:adenylyltransferase/sulfurtransferase